MLLYWEVSKHFRFLRNSMPHLFHVAMDILPVAASSVASERAFSSSKLTDAQHRNRLDPATFEAIQVLKFAMKRERMESTVDWRPAQEHKSLDHTDLDYGERIELDLEATRLFRQFRMDDLVTLLTKS